jgi:hypothetical protein
MIVGARARFRENLHCQPFWVRAVARVFTRNRLQWLNDLHAPVFDERHHRL